MIDKFFYWLFGIADSFGHWIEDYFNLHDKKCKCRICKKKKKLKNVITEEQWIKKIIGKKNGK